MKKLVFISLSLICAMANGQKKADPAHAVLDRVKELADADGPRLIEIFKDLHANPELPFMEVRTAAIVAKELRSHGYAVMEKIGKTGVVGILKNGDGPVVMFRADMDCNSVEEAVDLPYASKKRMKNEEGIEVPVMHACGHDAHTTWMLGIAKIMATMKNNWKGTLIMVGQPAEESGFGANAMADEMYKKGVPVPTYMLGMHTGPVGVGLYSNQPGERMAGADQLDVTFLGVGGHGSTPEYTKDPIIMAANAILQYQTIISRNMDPQRPAVLTVGAVEAGLDNNVIPASAKLKLNLRWYRNTDRTLMIERIQQINEGIAVANDLPKKLYPTLVFKQNVGVLDNNAALVKKIEPALVRVAGREPVQPFAATVAKVFGPAKNLNVPPVMGSEDFQQLTRDYPQVPYAFIHVGVANPAIFQKALSEGKMYPFTNHNPDFWVDL
nr:amidohydrolase [Cyclobacteriaceae bacterium]